MVGEVPGATPENLPDFKGYMHVVSRDVATALIPHELRLETVDTVMPMGGVDFTALPDSTRTILLQGDDAPAYQTNGTVVIVYSDMYIQFRPPQLQDGWQGEHGVGPGTFLDLETGIWSFDKPDYAGFTERLDAIFEKVRTGIKLSTQEMDFIHQSHIERRPAATEELDDLTGFFDAYLASLYERPQVREMVVYHADDSTRIFSAGAGDEHGETIDSLKLAS